MEAEALEMFKHGVVLGDATSVIKSSGCQSHLIAVRNFGHPDGSYLPEMHQGLMKQKRCAVGILSQKEICTEYAALSLLLTKLYFFVCSYSSLTVSLFSRLMADRRIKNKCNISGTKRTPNSQ